ncbi:BspA family leucine-rich repeat surface protein [Polaribacter sp.]|nr:BspA family leucine-rich repeat surface protein [Polaribacter sp.]
MQLKSSFSTTKYILFFLLFHGTLINAQTDFILKFNTENDAAGSNEIQLPITGIYDVDINNDGIYGDSDNTSLSLDNLSGNQTITFDTAGEHTIQVRPNPANNPSGELSISFNGYDPQKLVAIQQWGTAIVWTTMNAAFYNCSNLLITATDVPNLTQVSDMSSMFRGATSFDSELSSWDVSKVTNMSSVFYNASSFTSDLSAWDVSKVTNMSFMFYNASSFTSDLSDWSVSNVLNMSSMLRGATSFDSELSSWDVSKVTNMSSMFYNASSFTSDLSAWNVSNVTNMFSMFRVATHFNSDLSAWDVSNVTNTALMLYGTTQFDSDLSDWDVSNVIQMYLMFGAATSFTSDLSRWNVSNVTNMSGVFRGTTRFDSDLSSWNVSSVIHMSQMFKDAINFTSVLSDWNVSNVTNISEMFRGATHFDSDLSGWNVSSVTNMSQMFDGATHFNSDIIGWNVSKVTNMSYLFREATNFTSDLSDWKVSNVTNMFSMFKGATYFDSDLSGWNVSSVTNMSQMFDGATHFNTNLSGWNVSNVTQMYLIFRGATNFTSDLSEWNVSNVTNMSQIFKDATNFTSDLSGWDVSNVTDMGDMFTGATSFTSAHYDLLLNGWASLSAPGTRTFGAPPTTYCAGAAGRNTLVENHGWTITGDTGLQCTNAFLVGGTTDWDTASNWSLGAVPSSINNVALNSGTHIVASGDIVANNLSIGSSSSLTVAGNVNNSGTLSLSPEGALIAANTTPLDLTVNKALATSNWYLFSTPVVGQDIDVFATTEDIAVGTGSNRGIATYNNATPGYEYYQSGASGSGVFTPAIGSTIKLTTAGSVSFTGTLATDGISIGLTDNSGNEGNAYNLIGNPYPSFIPTNNSSDAAHNVLAFNSAELEEQTLWFWDQSTDSYNTINHASSSRFISPTEGFFVKAKIGGGTTNQFQFTEAMQHPEITGGAGRTSSRSEIKLSMSNGNTHKSTEIYYIEGTTTGFDNGYDSTVFGGANNSFNVFTHLVAGTDTRNFGIQTLPESNFETLIVPLGVKAEAGSTLTFTATSTNLPQEMNVYLEDKDTNSFSRLNTTDGTYTTTLTAALNGVGRFYVHTTQSVLKVEEALEATIRIYKTSNTNLRITSLQTQGAAKVKLYNLQGKEISNHSFMLEKNNNIALPSHLAQGVYLVQLQVNEVQQTNKIVID